MIRKILQAYNIDYNSSTVQPLSGGLINTTWLVAHNQPSVSSESSTSTRQYILQKINHDVLKNPELVAGNIRAIQRYLRLHYPGYLFVAPMRTVEGEDFFHGEEGYFRMFPFVEGSVTIESATNENQAFEAAAQFGRFTRLLNDFDVKGLHYTIPDFHNLTLRFKNFTDALQTGNTQRIARAKPEIRSIEHNFFIVEQYKKIEQSNAFRKRVTHHDTKISNVLFDRTGKGLCVIDLDTVMPGYFISDAGDMMRTYLSHANEEEKDLSKIEIRDDFFRAIVEGYGQEMRDFLSEDERKNFVYAGMFITCMQAIRFLEDYFRNDSYYGSKYEGHNLMRTKNQLRLLQCLQEKQPDLQRIINKEITRKSYMM